MYKVKTMKSWINNIYDFTFFFLILVTQNHSSAFLTITIILFYLRQATICLLRLFENSYDQKYIFAEDFQRQFNINFLIINLALLQTKYFPNQYFIMFKWMPMPFVNVNISYQWHSVILEPFVYSVS